LQTLEIAVESHKKITSLKTDSLWYREVFKTKEESERMARDSMIQRFEFCVDTFWKYFKDHLESIEKITLEIKSPRAIFRALCQARLLNEQETEFAINMVENRNRTSHIYKEEIAEKISSEIPSYYEFMIKIVNRISRV